MTEIDPDMLAALREYLAHSIAEAQTTLIENGELSKWDQGYVAAMKDTAREFYPLEEELWK
jgi:hypothetical protein